MPETIQAADGGGLAAAISGFGSQAESDRANEALPTGCESSPECSPDPAKSALQKEEVRSEPGSIGPDTAAEPTLGLEQSESAGEAAGEQHEPGDQKDHGLDLPPPAGAEAEPPPGAETPAPDLSAARQIPEEKTATGSPSTMQVLELGEDLDASGPTVEEALQNGRPLFLDHDKKLALRRNSKGRLILHWEEEIDPGFRVDTAKKAVMEIMLNSSEYERPIASLQRKILQSFHDAGDECRRDFLGNSFVRDMLLTSKLYVLKNCTLKDCIFNADMAAGGTVKSVHLTGAGVLRLRGTDVLLSDVIARRGILDLEFDRTRCVKVKVTEAAALRGRPGQLDLDGDCQLSCFAPDADFSKIVLPEKGPLPQLKGLVVSEKCPEVILDRFNASALATDDFLSRKKAVSAHFAPRAICEMFAALAEGWRYRSPKKTTGGSDEFRESLNACHKLVGGKGREKYSLYFSEREDEPAVRIYGTSPDGSVLQTLIKLPEDVPFDRFDAILVLLDHFFEQDAGFLEILRRRLRKNKRDLTKGLRRAN